MSKEVRFGDVLKSTTTFAGMPTMVIGIGPPQYQPGLPGHVAYSYIRLECPAAYEDQRIGTGNWFEEDQWEVVAADHDEH